MFAILAATLGLLASLVIGETLLRVYVASRGWTPNCYVTGLIFFVPHERAGYTLRPNLRLKSSTYDVTTTSEGLRASQPIATPQHADQPSHTRILVLGGSSVFGYLVPDGLDSCVALETALKNELGDEQSIDVLNAGVPGYNIQQCRLRFEDDLGELNPDYVLLYLGWNDTKFIISESPEQLDATPDAPALWQRLCANSVLYGVVRYRIFPPAAPKFAIPPSSQTRVTEAGSEYFLGQLRQLVASIRSAGATPIISTQLMAATSTSNSLTAFLGEDEEQIAANRAVGQWITDQLRAIALAEKITLIDTAAQVECDDQTLGDAIHLTQLGHEKVAAAWAETISEKLLESEAAAN
ncbi:MAG: hypothetical protein Aurels2KO_27660 [Aureliella sp.]